MAIEVTLVPELTPVVTAAVDLRTHTNKFVQVTPLGVVLADVRSAGGAFVLKNAPNTGQDCTISGVTNIPRVIAGEAIAIGQFVQPMSASGLAGVSAVGSLANAGIAWTAAAGSGEYLAVGLGY